MNSKLKYLNIVNSDLTKLEDLTIDLSMKDLTNEDVAVLAKELEQCHKLNTLKCGIGSNKLNNEGIQRISEAISSLENLALVDLNISANEYDIKGIQVLFQNLEKLPKLANLTLDMSNQPHGKNGQEIGDALSRLSHLTYLELVFGECQFDDENLIHLSKSISKLTHLISFTFDFYKSTLTSEGIKAMGQELTKLTKLQQLTALFISVGCGKDDPLLFAQTISGMNHLEQLSINFGSNDILDGGSKGFGSEISKLRNLYRLSLTFNKCKIGPETIKSIFEGLSKSLVELLYINLYNNTLQDEGGVALGDEIAKFPHIYDLSLSLGESGIGNKGVQHLIKSISQIKSIEKLKMNMSQCGLQKNSFENFEVLEVCEKLNKLDLHISDNSLEDEGIQLISNSLKKLKHLRTLYFQYSGNSLSEGFGTKIEDDISKNMTQLTDKYIEHS